MTKTVIFVEGQTELIFIRELLLKVFDFQNISLKCFNLVTDSNLSPAEYTFSNAEAEYFFQIVNVGNDKSVLTNILRREQYIWKAGFSRIIGLRDMYSMEYRELVKNHAIDEALNQKFIKGHRAQIKSENIYFSFAIMEVEAWLLGLRKSFARMDQQLTPEFIEKHLGFNLEAVNPEKEFFHPAGEIEAIFKLAGKNYSKSKGDISAIVSFIKKEDYIELLHSDKCNSFKEFYEFLQV